MYRIIACDLDETLLNDEHEVSERDIESIKKAAAEGIRFVLASGRGFTSMFPLMKQLGLNDSENEYTIRYNGAVITENRNNKVLYSAGLDFEKASRLFEFGVRKRLCVHVYTLDNVYIHNYIAAERYHVEGRMPIIEYFEDDIEQMRDSGIIKVLYMDPDMEKLKSLEPEMGELLKDVQVSYSSNRYMEFTTAGIRKATGLVHLAQILNDDISETVAVGDHLNDLPMIETAGLGVAVANAVEEVKAAAGLVLKATNNDDPITELLEHLKSMA
ncbi:MAG: HAD family phosphatase [Erysipelotrichaceae bacterium]|nr:HAD family phosphatase [Erysipelotrichaceae bacterium]